MKSFAILFAACLPLAVHAQAGADASAPKRPLWEYGLSGLAVSQPSYPGSANKVSRGLLLPWFVYRGEVFRADGNNVGARLVKEDRFEFDMGFAAALGSSSNSNPARAGMPNLGFQFEFGPRAKYRLLQFDERTRLGLDVPLRAALELKSGVQHRGWVTEPRIELERAQFGMRLQATASAAFADQRYGQFLYGVEPQYAAPKRAAYVGQAGLVSTRLSATAYKSFAPDWGGFVFVRHDNAASSANKSSPLFQQASGNTVGVGLAWTIGRSSTFAKD